MPTVSISDLEKWKNRIESITKYWEADGRKETWQEYIDMYQNRFNVTVRGALDQVNVNHVFPNVRIKSAFLAQKKPKIFISPRKPKWFDAAQILESAINAVWQVNNVAWTMRMVLLDSGIFPHAAVRVGYQFDEDRFSEATPDFPFVKRVSPRDIFWDLNIADSNPRTGRFMFERVFTTKAQLKENNFKHIDDIGPIGFESDYFKRKDQGGRLRSVMRQSVDTDSEIVQIFRLQDKINRLNIWMSLDGDAPHFVEEWKLPLTSFDYHVLQFNPVPDQVFGLSDIESYRNQQLELNKIRTFMINHINRAARRWVVPKGHLTPDEKNELLESSDQMLVEISGDPNKIMPLSDAPMPADFFRVQQFIEEDIRKLSGVSEYEVAGSIPGGDTTATAAALVTQASKRRSDDMNAIYEKFLSDVARDLVHILQDFVPTDFWIQVADPDKVQAMQQLTEYQGNFFKVKKNQIQGDMVVSIDPGSMTEQNDALRIQQFTQVLSLIMSQPQIIQQVNMDKLMRHIFEMFDFPQDVVKSQEQILQEQQMQQMQQMMMQGGGEQGNGDMAVSQEQGLINQGSPENLDLNNLGQLLAQANNFGGLGGQVG